MHMFTDKFLNIVLVLRLWPLKNSEQLLFVCKHGHLSQLCQSGRINKASFKMLMEVCNKVLILKFLRDLPKMKYFVSN
jgi:hypothetical protein